MLIPAGRNIGGMDIREQRGRIVRDMEYYKWSDGFFTYYINPKTGEKKLNLQDGDYEVPAPTDDFCREVARR